MARLRGASPVDGARRWFALQAVAGAAWWVAVAASERVRDATLGTWDPWLVAVPDLALFVGAAAVAATTGRVRWAAASATWTVAVTAALVATSIATGRAGLGAAAMVLASAGSVVAALTLWRGHLPLEWFFVGPFRFREAEAATPRAHLWRSVRQLVLFWSVLLVGLPVVVAWAERQMGLDLGALDGPWAVGVGVATFAVGSALGIWSMATMALRGRGTPLPAATASALVVAGPYRFVRNPMAVAGATQTIGAGLVLGSWVVLVAAVAGGVAWDRFIRPTEEADLRDRFGEPYEAYRRRVRCWVPQLGALRRDRPR